jgi:hypothetical protein
MRRRDRGLTFVAEMAYVDHRFPFSASFDQLLAKVILIVILVEPHRVCRQRRDVANAFKGLQFHMVIDKTEGYTIIVPALSS